VNATAVNFYLRTTDIFLLVYLTIHSEIRGLYSTEWKDNMNDELETIWEVITVYFKCYSLGGTEENHKKTWNLLNMKQDYQLTKMLGTVDLDYKLQKHFYKTEKSTHITVL
jgi:hypothetical protein